MQADTRNVYQRMPRSRMYMGVFVTLFSVGMYGTVVGIYNMALVSIRFASTSACLTQNNFILILLCFRMLLSNRARRDKPKILQRKPLLSTQLISARMSRLTVHSTTYQWCDS